MRKWIIIDESLKKTKLKPDEKLYCEGSLKPYWRGKMHLLAFIFFPLAITSLLEVSETRSEVLIGSFIFSMSNMISYGISFMFHCFEWSPQVEVSYISIFIIFITFIIFIINNFLQIDFITKIRSCCYICKYCCCYNSILCFCCSN